jgi:hypothetical protein
MDRSWQPDEERCTECGFLWSMPVDEAIAVVEAAAKEYEHSLSVGVGPPSDEPGSWSATGYLWHVVDVLRLGTERLWTLLLEPGSKVPGWDQEALAAARRYELLPVTVGLRALEWAARDWVRAATEAPVDAQVEHPVFGRLATAESIRRNAHEVRHHALDIRRAVGTEDRAAQPDPRSDPKPGAGGARM